MVRVACSGVALLVLCRSEERLGLSVGRYAEGRARLRTGELVSEPVIRRGEFPVPDSLKQWNSRTPAFVCLSMTKRT